MSKLLFFDIDATLCLPGEAPSPRTVSAIRAARAKGHKVFLSTGRNRSGIPPAVDAIGFDGYISNAGASAQVGDHILLDEPTPVPLLEQTLSILRAGDACFLLQTADGNYLDFAQQEAIFQDPEVAQYLEPFRKILSVRDYAEYTGSPVYKLCFFTTDDAHFQALKPQLEPVYHFTLFDNLFPGLSVVSGELNRKGVDKGRALNAICAYLGQSPADTIAFGDSTNDSAMLLAAGLGVAMENGQEEVKALADRICPPCWEDGVAQTLEELGLV